MADEQENKTGFDTSDDFHADTSVPNSGVADTVDFDDSLPRPISDIEDDVSTPRENDADEERQSDRDRNS